MVIDIKTDDQRMRQYKILTTAFCYPDDAFFEVFPELLADKRDILAEYDRIFRAGIVWLYEAEHSVENEFQRANLLSDVMGFYNAFGFEPALDRPDAISCELEFMYALILKRNHASQLDADANAKEKAEVCLDAEKKFFVQHLTPAAASIAEKIIAQSENSFYVNIAKDMIEFMETESKHYELTTVIDDK